MSKKKRKDGGDLQRNSVLILKNAITPQWKVIALTKKLLSSKQSTPLYSIEISPVEELFLPGGHLEMAVISPPMSLDEIDIKKGSIISVVGKSTMEIMEPF